MTRNLRSLLLAIAAWAAAGSSGAWAQDSTPPRQAEQAPQLESNPSGQSQSVPGVLVVPGAPLALPSRPQSRDEPQRQHGGCRYDGQRLDLLV